MPTRRRHIEPSDPGGDPICLLTPEGAHERHVPIDRLLIQGKFLAAGAGYQIQLPPGEEYWRVANEFAQEEAACCASLDFEVEESSTAIVLRASC